MNTSGSGEERGPIIALHSEWDFRPGVDRNRGPRSRRCARAPRAGDFGGTIFSTGRRSGRQAQAGRRRGRRIARAAWRGACAGRGANPGEARERRERQDRCSVSEERHGDGEETRKTGRGDTDGPARRAPPTTSDRRIMARPSRRIRQKSPTADATGSSSSGTPIAASAMVGSTTSAVPAARVRPTRKARDSSRTGWDGSR